MEVSQVTALTDDTEMIPNTSVCSYCQWYEMSPRPNITPLSVISINVRSLAGKFAELTSYLSSSAIKFTFIIIVESWLTFEKDKALEFEGYKSHAIYRADQVGGGMKLYYLNHINVTVISEFTGVFESCECITVKATVPGCGKINVVSIYRPPCKPFVEFEN